MSSEGEYVLGTHDAEIERLGMQHAVWRPDATAAWRRAGFKTGHRILDVGCGPGWAAFDLAQVVGQDGEVIALDRSKRFLAAGRTRAHVLGIETIRFVEHDLDRSDIGWPAVEADGAWVRWVFAFVTTPRLLLQEMSQALKPGASLVIHEYFDYGTWQLQPRSAAFSAFVEAVKQSWRDAGGEPDIALPLSGWLPELGFEVQRVAPIVHAVRRTDFVARWPVAFARAGLPRLVESGHLRPDEAEATRRELDAYEASAHAVMITPGVLEIMAVRR